MHNPQLHQQQKDLQALSRPKHMQGVAVHELEPPSWEDGILKASVSFNCMVAALLDYKAPLDRSHTPDSSAAVSLCTNTTHTDRGC
jgi:hypothetical protein